MEINYKISSNLILVSTLLMIISFFTDSLLLRDGIAYAIFIGMIVIFLVLAFLVRKQIPWMKYVLLLFFGLGSLGIFADLSGFMMQDYNQIIVGVVQTILQFASVILLFIKPLKKSNS